MRTSIKKTGKLLLTAAFFITIATTSVAQNVGIGVTEPTQKLTVAGNLVVTPKSVISNAVPTPSQTITQINGNNVNVSGSDSVVRIFDPGGPSGNYLPNLMSTVTIFRTVQSDGYLLDFEQIQLGLLDSIIVFKETVGGTRLLTLSSNNNTPAKYSIGGFYDLIILFKSNNDASVGSGFALKINRVYIVNQSEPDLNANSLVGQSFSFNSKSGALNAGYDNNNSGSNSITFGSLNVATGSHSIAIGQDNKALQFNSVAIGYQNYLAGRSSYVMGEYNNVLGDDNNVFGRFLETNADASFSFGMGLINRTHRNTVLGSYNKLPTTLGSGCCWSSQDQLFVIGNGEGLNSRSNALSMLKNGFTGIGIDEPTAPLHVKDKMIIEQPAATGLASFEWRSNNAYRGAFGYDATAGRFFFFEGESGQNVFFINNGRFGIRRDATTNALEVGGEASKSTAGSWLGNSDARLKKNMMPIESALDKLLQLKGITYEWNDNSTGYNRPNGTQFGFTAQNVQQVFPTMVSSDAQGYLQTAYGTYDPLMVEAIRELKNENELLKKEIEAIKALLLKK